MPLGGVFIDFCPIYMFPIDVRNIARMAGVHVIKESDAHLLREGDYGRIFYTPDAGWNIVYDDTLSTEFARFVIAHELGHMFLGHKYALAKYIHTRTYIPGKTPPAEEQANRFAERLLCPACVIWGIGLSSPQEIADYCRVELSVAEKRYKRMQILNERGKYLSDPTEKQLYECFRSYIEQTREERAAGIYVPSQRRTGALNIQNGNFSIIQKP